MVRSTRARLELLERSIIDKGLHLGRCGACDFPRQSDSAVILERDEGRKCEVCGGPVDGRGQSLEKVGPTGEYEQVLTTVIGFRPRTDGKPTPKPMRSNGWERAAALPEWGSPPARS